MKSHRHLLLALVVFAAVVGAATWAVADDSAEDEEVQTVKLPRFYLYGRTVHQLNRIFSEAEPGSELPVNLLFTVSGGTGQRLFAEIHVEQGSLTMFTKSGHVEFGPELKTVVPDAEQDKSARKYNYDMDRGVIGIGYWVPRTEKGSDEVSRRAQLTVGTDRYVETIYSRLPLAAEDRKDGNEPPLQLRFRLSDDYRGSINWWVASGPK